MSELLFDVAGVKITVTLICAVLSIAVLILYMSLWLCGRKKRTGEPIFAGQVMNGIGFGLLPALALLKAFQSLSPETGSKVFEPLPLLRWLTEKQFFVPGRIETAAAAACFAVICLWIIIRKTDLPDNGDLLIIAMCTWATIRLVTEDFRTDPQDIFRYASCATLLAALVLWSVRKMKIIHTPVRMIADLLAAGICAAVYLVTARGILTAGSEIADFAVKAGSSALLLMLTLVVGGDLRKLSGKKAAKTEPAENPA